jgi:hypothetical protein
MCGIDIKPSVRRSVVGLGVVKERDSAGRWPIRVEWGSVEVEERKKDCMPNISSGRYPLFSIRRATEYQRMWCG